MNALNTFLNKLGQWKLVLILSFTLTFLIPIFLNAQVVSPRISLTSSQDSSGMTVNLKGTGFSNNGTASIYSKNPDGSQSPLQSPGISSQGSFDIYHLFPIGYLQGKCLLWAIDNITGKYSNAIELIVAATQSIELKPLLQGYTPKHGDLIRAKGDTKVHLVQSGQRRCIANEEVFKQMGFKRNSVKDLDLQDVMNIPEGPPIWSNEIVGSYPDGTLIRLQGKTQTYVIQGGRKCYIPDPETFQSRGYSWNQVLEVDQGTFESVLTGIPIPSIKPPFQYIPPGQPSWGQPPYYPVPPPYAPSLPPPSSWPPSPYPYGSSTIPPSTGPSPYQPPPSSFSSFPNGTLIKGSGPDIYLIENGFRRQIPDMETFNAMGFNLGSIVNVDDQRLGNIPLGAPLPFKKTLGK